MMPAVELFTNNHDLLSISLADSTGNKCMFTTDEMREVLSDVFHCLVEAIEVGV
jgi:hypothetical protein